MDPMSEYLAKAAIDAHVARAQERRPGRQIEKERRRRTTGGRRPLVASPCRPGLRPRHPGAGLQRAPAFGDRRAGRAAGGGGPPHRRGGDRLGTAPARRHGRGHRGHGTGFRGRPGGPRRHRDRPAAGVRPAAHPPAGGARSARARAAPRPPRRSGDLRSRGARGLMERRPPVPRSTS